MSGTTAVVLNISEINFLYGIWHFIVIKWAGDTALTMKVGNDTVDDTKLTSYSIAGIDTSKSFD